MKRSLVIAALLGGCAYFDSDAGPGDPPQPSPDAREPVVIPPGVWEPVPGALIANASLASEDGTIWWIYTRTEPSQSNVWLAATSPSGTPIVAPSHVALLAAYHTDLAITPSAIVTSFGRSSTSLRRFDRTGTALGDAYPLVIENNGTTINDPWPRELVPTASGGVRFVASLDYYTSAEVAIAELDAGGAQSSTVFFGTPDSYQSIPSTASGATAAARSDGSTLVAWSRAYIACVPLLPFSTLTTSLTGTTVGAIEPVGDVPELGEVAPSIASSGDTAYITWQIEEDSYVSSRIALAKFPDVTTALTEIGDPDDRNSQPTLTLADASHGAILYHSDKDLGGTRYSLGTRYVVAFTESGGSVQLSEPRLIPLVDPDASSVRTFGLVHVSGDRYVTAWSEYREEQQRLYAMEIDFADAMMRPAPAFDAKRAPAPRAVAKLPCP